MDNGRKIVDILPEELVQIRKALFIHLKWLNRAKETASTDEARTNFDNSIRTTKSALEKLNISS